MTFRDKLRTAAVLATCAVPATLVAAAPAGAAGLPANPDAIVKHFQPFGLSASFDLQPELPGATRPALHILGP